MKETTEKEEQQHFRRVLCIVVAAHIGLACIPLGWVSRSKSTEMQACVVSNDAKEIEWLEPVVVADSTPESDAMVARVVSRTPLMDDAILPPPGLPETVEEHADFEAEFENADVTASTPDNKETGVSSPSPTAKPTQTPTNRTPATSKRSRLAKSSFHPGKPAADDHLESELVTAHSGPETTAENVISTAPPTGESQISGSEMDAISAYHDRIQKLMQKNWRQPKEAASGTPPARVALTISRGGVISDSRLALSSGNEAVDQSAMNAVRSVQVIDPLPTAIRSDSYQLIIKFVLH